MHDLYNLLNELFENKMSDVVLLHGTEQYLKETAIEAIAVHYNRRCRGLPSRAAGGLLSCLAFFPACAHAGGTAGAWNCGSGFGGSVFPRACITQSNLLL